MSVKFYTNSILFIAAMALLPMSVFAMERQLPNAGFVSQNIWYSNQKFFAGDKVVIHAIITSGGEYDFSGIVKFYDGKNLIGTKDFFVKSGDYVKDAQIDWTATEGNHKINAQISDSKIIVDGNEVPIDVSNNEALGKESFIDIDTDGDGIGNKEDLDDDGDGISDEEEIRNGTDPLKKNIKNNIEKNKAVEATIVSDGISLSNVARKAGDVAENKVMPVASRVAKKVFELTENARVTQKKFADKKILEVKGEIIKEKKNKKSDKTKEGLNTRKPFNYILLFTMTFLSYVSKYKALYYGLIVIVTIYFLIVLWKRWRSRDY